MTESTKVSEKSASGTGFGIMPKYQVSQPEKLHDKIQSCTDKAEQLAKIVDVGGIWSDDDEMNVGQPRPKSTNNKHAEDKLQKLPAEVINAHDCYSLQADMVSTNFGESRENKISGDSDDQLTIGGNVQANKKPIIFNIKLPKQTAKSDQSMPPNEKKKKVKRRKKLNDVKTSSSMSTQHQTSEAVTQCEASSVVTKAPSSIGKTDDTKTSLCSMYGFDPNQVALYSHAPYYSLPVAFSYLHSYHMHYGPPHLHTYMQYQLRQAMHNFQPPLPSQEKRPPLPEYGK